ncbi:DUF2254 domain-containing protein [Demequina aestuarii]|uniref:DUF2254 domain-containing protein n=1 Tax=Demequina aestuarii TaxID=327095 RepID=UPI000780C9BA|nr:DUF2254 domain-containing protein [Demequina aestuarii]
MAGIEWRTFVARLAQRIWFRLALFTVLALAVSLLGRFAGPALPEAWALDFGQDSVATILQILASSMLAVTTFSLTVMISAYSGAAAQTTPRATQLLLADNTSQNALSSFLGSFVFAIVGIVALSTSYYGERGRTLLFLGTLLVIAIVVATLVRWIHHLTNFGRMADVLDRVEKAAHDTVCAYATAPTLGGAAATDVPASARAIRADAAGCVTGIAVAALADAAERARLTVHVAALPGVMVGLGTPLAYVEGFADDGTADAVREAFRVEKHRTFEQDPRLGLVALSEIGSRALSPSTNDPGTAIEALNAIQRVLTDLLTTSADSEVAHPSLRVPTVSLEDLIEDALRPLARDGAGIVEVGLRVQRVLGDLIAIADSEAAASLRAASEHAEQRAVGGLPDEGDRDLITAAGAKARARHER